MKKVPWRLLLVLIGFITVGVLAVGGFSYFQESAERRDEKRRADLTEWHRLFEEYHQDKGRYPVGGGSVAKEDTDQGILAEITATKPAPRPPGKADRYLYQGKAGGYVFCLPLEVANNPTAIFDTLGGQFEAAADKCTDQVSVDAAQLISSDGLTREAADIFFQTNPQITDKRTVRSKCEGTVDTETAVYGCYNGAIFILDISDPSLEPEENVIAAHEMLHAVYEKIPEQEKNHLNQLLEEQRSKHRNSRLEELLGLYESSRRLDEFHARLATEEPTLIPALEEHYKKYFRDRKKILDYHRPFRSLEQEISDIEAKIAPMKRRLDSLLAAGRYQEYNALVDDYNVLVAQHNERVRRLRALTE